jgi:hypothetical protein
LDLKGSDVLDRLIKEANDVRIFILRKDDRAYMYPALQGQIQECSVGQETFECEGQEGEGWWTCGVRDFRDQLLKTFPKSGYPHSLVRAKHGIDC